jgi:hypothetical protein
VYIIKDSTASANATRDSLQKIYRATINNMGTLDSTWTQADSLKGNLDVKLSEFYKLRNEIADILKNPAKKEDLDLAKQKIGELQKRVDQLRDRNLDVEKENKRLYAILQQLTNEQKQAVQNIKPVVYENKGPADNNIPATTATPFAASDIRLSAMMVDEGKERETLQALQTDKLVGSFIVKNNTTQFNKAEVVVVILQPDGKTLQNSAWETGRFETKEGRKIYSCKVSFDYNKGETKRLSFSLNTDKSLKGNYTVQLYHNGTLIGKTVKTLI